jgi:hypothetical protein
VAVEQLGGATTDVQTSSANSHSFSHTVTEGTTLLIAAVGVTADREFHTAPQYNSETMTAISDTGEGNSTDMRVYVYGLINPDAGENTFFCQFGTPINPPASWVTLVNYKGTQNSSVADVTNSVETVSNTSTTSTTEFSSGGSAGNALFLAAGGIGENMSPASSSFTEIADTVTGGGANNNNDHAIYVAHLLTGAPSAVTVTWSATDENAGALVELVANRSGFRGSGRGIARGVGRGIL